LSVQWPPRFSTNSFATANDVYPAIGALPIRDVTATAILAILRSVEDRGATDMAGLGRGFVGQVFRYGVATERCAADPTAAMRGALKAHTKQHHAPLERADMPAFFAALGTIPLARETEIAVRLLAYLFVRPGELRAAQWSEIDLDAAEWRGCSVPPLFVPDLAAAHCRTTAARIAHAAAVGPAPVAGTGGPASPAHCRAAAAQRTRPPYTPRFPASVGSGERLLISLQRRHHFLGEQP